MKSALSVAACLAALLLGGCGGSDDSPEPDRKTSASPSPTPGIESGKLTIEPGAKPDRPTDVQSEDGAIAFSGYVMQMIIYTISTHDADPFLKLASGPECVACIKIAQGTTKRGDVVQRPTDITTISDFKTEKGSDALYLVIQNMAIPRVEEVNLKTKKVEGTLSPVVKEITAKVVWEDGKWKLSDYSADDVAKP